MGIISSKSSTVGVTASVQVIVPIKTPKEKALEIIEKRKYDKYLDLSGLDLTDEMSLKYLSM